MDKDYALKKQIKAQKFLKRIKEVNQKIETSLWLGHIN